MKLFAASRIGSAPEDDAFAVVCAYTLEQGRALAQEALGNADRGYNVAELPAITTTVYNPQVLWESSKVSGK